MSKKYTITIILGVLVLVSILAIGSNTYLRRYFLLLMPDVYDYDKLPHRTVQNGPNVFHFDEDHSLTSSDLPDLAYKGQAISDLDQFLEEHDTTAFLIIKDGAILYEKYFNGHQRDSLCKSFSVTKSVLSALIGIAVDEGYIESIDDPVQRYVPELQNEGLEALTIRHCLMARSGLRYVKGYLPWHDQPRMFYGSDVRQLLFNVELEHEPGTTARSDEEYGTLLLGLVLERATNTTMSEYLQTKIWQPAGMEYPALWNVDSQENGFEKTESGLSARAIDLAKFGGLFLNDGMWNGKQIVPQDWVRDSTTVGPGEERGEADFYNYRWWLPLSDETRPDFYANGHFGQRIYVSPTNNIVVVRMGRDSSGIGWSGFISGLIETLEGER